METIEQKKDTRNEFLKSVVVDPKRMTGAWEVKIEVTGTEGLKSFGGKMLSEYAHPLTGVSVPLVNLNGHVELGLMLERHITIYKPDENPMDRRIVDWLLCHPRVGIEGIDLKDAVKMKKDSNPTIKMRNLDRQEMSEIDDSDTIDYVIGKLSDESSTKGLSLEKFRYLLAYFNLPYFEKRYINNKTTERKILRTKMKNFCRLTGPDGTLNALKVEAVLDEIDNLKYSYEFKEMLRHNIIRESNGMYKYNNVPIGTKEESVVNFFKTNLEIYTEMVGQLYPILKSEGFSFK